MFVTQTQQENSTAEFSAAAAVVVVVQFLFWSPEDGATKEDGRVSGVEVPGSQRDKDTHRRTLSVLQNQWRPKSRLDQAQ